jgi:hypothetical protein
MNDKVDAYSFLPWLRHGIANNIKTQDLDNSVKVRASASIELTLKGKGIGETKTETISKDVALYGPGDVIGIESKAIIKTEPRDWITNFEENYLAYIDFYDEGFPWRYTPAAPDTVTDPQNGLGRLRPWIMLVVLKDDEFKDGRNISGKPLPCIEVTNAAEVFPSADQLWAWAHVHINEDIVKLEDDIENKESDTVITKLIDVLNNNPDLAYSRIMCPRKLVANTAYHAFLIPVFESGRLAGLGSEVPSDIPATKSSWDGSQKEFPYYYRWYFRTGTVGDFEYLVRLLEPKPVDNRVGRRDVDVLDPGSNINGIADEELGGILKLGGALQIPWETMPKEDKAVVLKFENWDRLDDLKALSNNKKEELFEKDNVTKVEQTKPHKFQKDLASFINLSDDYSVREAPDANKNSELNDIIEDQDPVITPPLYGQWHAMVQRLLEEQDGSTISHSDNWVHELNLDPRWRVTVGFGTKVIQDNQEEYMDAAWGQVGEILEANRKIRLAQLAKETSSVFYNKHVIPIREKNIEKVLMFTAPVQKRIVAQGLTVYHQVKASRLPYAIISTTMRRIIRPHGRVMRSLPFADNIQSENLIERINKEKVFPAPPKEVPESIPTLRDLSKSLRPENILDVILDILSKFTWFQYLPLFLAVVLLIFLYFSGFTRLSWAITSPILLGSIYLYTLLKKWTQKVKDAESVLEKNQTSKIVDKLPKSPDFRITDMSEGIKPGRGATDSQEAGRFKTALRNTYEFVQLSGKAGITPKLKELNIKVMVDETIKGINPQMTIPRLVLNSIRIPERIFKIIGEEFKEAMAYPEIDIPMYKPLVDISSELFLPNINYISQNSVTLLETNQKFIEAYMVGLNHEFARELLWREYPTDQRGSYFRQFWDVSNYRDPTETDPEKLREKLRDIPPLHKWSRASDLGDHDYREQQGDKEEEVVLVIRGELLKKYPTAVIYAHKAEWQMKDGKIDKSKVRLLVALEGDELETPPQDKVKTPLYQAKVDPDVFFFGFDLTTEEVKGGTGDNPDDKPGWFFVIKERPGEPRFGLDVGKSEEVYVWNDLSWGKLAVSDDRYISIPKDTTSSITLKNPHGNEELREKYEQYDEDMHLTWNEKMNAAEVAYILYQVPVLVAIHASEMLGKNEKEK